jgi:uncharacterized caspase-like protein
MTAVSKLSARFTWVLVCALGVAFIPAAVAEKLQTVAAVKPAPGGERRVALVLGNSAYRTAPLRNPARDARAMAKVLSETGFAVTLIEDGSQAGMRRAIRSFGDELARGGVGLFFFAGHGMQVHGKNYLIPVNADIEREDEIEDQAVDANLVLSKMDSARNSLNIMILDACRNNPFQRSFRSGQRGLAQMDAPSGTLISFATAPGSVASDGEGENGLFTKHLLAAIRQPGLPIEQLFKQVRIGVSRETRDRQIPWESSSLKGDFFFLAPDLAATAAAQKESIDKAVGEAVKREQDKGAAERAAMQAEMQKLMEQLFAKQKAEMDEEIRRRANAAGTQVPPPASVAAGPAPDAAARAEAAKRKAELEARQRAELAAREKQNLEAKAPVQVAAVRPTALPASLTAALPRAGDRWTYRDTDVTARQINEVVVEVKLANESGVLEEVTSKQGRDQWAWNPVASVVGQGDVTVFSPYLFAFDKPTPGHKWRQIPYQRYCTWAGVRACYFEAKYIGRERVTVPAGTFNAHKIEVDELIQGNRLTTTRLLTYWYADEVKRYVKVTRQNYHSWSWLSEIESELLSYKVQ